MVGGYAYPRGRRLREDGAPTELAAQRIGSEGVDDHH